MSFKTTLAQPVVAADSLTPISFVIKVKDLHDFFADSEYGASRPDPSNIKYSGPYPADLFCTNPDFNIFDLAVGTTYQFSIAMDEAHEGYSNLQIEEVDFVFLSRMFPGFNWNGIFKLNGDHCAPIIEIIPSTPSETFTIETASTIAEDYKKNLQYGIIFSFEVNGDKKWGVIDPFIKHTTTPPTT